jgi:phosphoribosylanthranilate isomerase
VTFEIKICGITTPDGVAAAAEAGATAIGLVFAESVRQVGIAKATELVRLCPEGIVRVAVFRHPGPDEVAMVLDSMPIDCVQTDAGDYPRIAGVLQGTPFRPVYRDGPELSADVEAGGRLGLNNDGILVEGPRSGSGVAPDWKRIARLSRSLRIILAGGLTPQNVGEAIRIVQPAGVDASSGVESSPGIKDPAKIAAFVRVAREASRLASEAGPPPVQQKERTT